MDEIQVSLPKPDWFIILDALQYAGSRLCLTDESKAERLIQPMINMQAQIAIVDVIAKFEELE